MLQVPPFFPDDTGFATITNLDFKPVAGDTNQAAYVARIMARFVAACATAPGINTVIGLYQPFHGCFIDSNRRFIKSTELIEYQLGGIYKNATRHPEMYAHVFVGALGVDVEDDEDDDNP